MSNKSYFGTVIRILHFYTCGSHFIEAVGSVTFFMLYNVESCVRHMATVFVFSVFVTWPTEGI